MYETSATAKVPAVEAPEASASAIGSVPSTSIDQRCGDQVGPGRPEPVDGGGEEVEQGRLGASLLFDLLAHPAAPATGSPTASVIVPSAAPTSTVSPSPTSPESTFSASGFSTSRCRVRFSGRAPNAGS